MKIEVEVQTVAELQEAIAAGADIVMLDNMSIEEMQRSCEIARGRCLLEASGGLSLEKLRRAAATGVDMASVGCLTHSVQALDIHLELEPG
jgi:nicotinate-nucleotide pyrophosphorylase (carboxylating)